MYHKGDSSGRVGLGWKVKRKVGLLVLGLAIVVGLEPGLGLGPGLWLRLAPNTFQGTRSPSFIRIMGPAGLGLGLEQLGLGLGLEGSRPGLVGFTGPGSCRHV